MSRYRLTSPVPEGYGWWVVADTLDEIMPNNEVAKFSESMPNAQREASELCWRLNHPKGFAANWWIYILFGLFLALAFYGLWRLII